MFGGGALERMSIFALGIMPYISSSIITQLLVATRPLSSSCVKGEAGRKKISQYTRYGTLAGARSRDGDEQWTCVPRTVVYQLAHVPLRCRHYVGNGCDVHYVVG